MRHRPGEQARRVDEVRTRLLVGAPPRLAGGLPPRVERALELASTVGAPGVPAVDAALAALADQRRHDQALTVATAQARAVAVGLGCLPLVAVVALSILLDEPLWRFYLTASGAVVGAAGLGLAGLGVAAGLLLVRRARRTTAPTSALVPSLFVGATLAMLGPPLLALGCAAATGAILRRRPSDVAPVPGSDEVADLVATGMSGGLTAAGALRAAANLLPRHARDLRRAAVALELGVAPDLPPGLDRVGSVLVDVLRWGAPAEPPLRRVAADLRADRLALALVAAERLPALLVFPTALCLLPACVLLVGAPLVAAGLTAAGGNT